MRLYLILAAGAAVLLPGPAEAWIGNNRWCAVVNTGWRNVEEICIYRTIEECRPRILAGNRGFCNENPRYIEVPVKRTKKRRVKG